MAVRTGKGVTGSVSKSDVGMDVVLRKRSEPQLWVDTQTARGYGRCNARGTDRGP